MSRFTLDSATEFLFGSCVHSLSARSPYAHNSPRRPSAAQPHPSDHFAAAFSQAQHQIALRSRLTDSWPLGEFWKDNTKDSMKVINDYIGPILRNALAKEGQTDKQKPKRADVVEESLLDHLVKLSDGEL